MPTQNVRIGIVGAGDNTRRRHIPGFRAIDGVEIVGVVNRTPESTARAAADFGIPKTYADWRELVADADVDAVMIGTWPNLHCDVTCAALEAGKHVLCEARMARDAAEARRMFETAHRHPQLVTQIVPSPIGLVPDAYVKQLLAEGFLGELRELVVIGADDKFHDATQPLHWRQDAEISGKNVLALGILHETAMRWTPGTARVLADTETFEPARPAADGRGTVAATVPDSVRVVTHLENGARGLYHFSGIDLFGPGMQIHLYGSEGTIKYLFAPQERLLVGRRGDAELREATIPPERRGGWRVEAEFIGAIRGEERVRFTDFATGVRYMEFTDAVARSAASGTWVDLPQSESD